MKSIIIIEIYYLNISGDSGGPIASISQFKTLVRVFLYGVVSAGLACERSDVIFPGIYTNIGYYLDWILDNMRS